MSIDSKFIFSIMLMSFCFPGPHYYIVVRGCLSSRGLYPAFLFALRGGSDGYSHQCRSHTSGFSFAVSLRSWNCRTPSPATFPMV